MVSPACAFTPNRGQIFLLSVPTVRTYRTTQPVPTMAAGFPYQNPDGQWVVGNGTLRLSMQIALGNFEENLQDRLYKVHSNTVYIARLNRTILYGDLRAVDVANLEASRLALQQENQRLRAQMAAIREHIRVVREVLQGLANNP